MTKRVFALSIAVAVAATLTMAPSDSAAEEGKTYVGHSQCRICHNKKDEGEQWNSWKSEDHARAFETLSTDAAIALGKELGLEKPPAESPECLVCHVTAYDVEKLAPPDKINLADGVQCERCHGPASAHVIEGKKHRSGDETAEPAKLMVHPDKQICLTCHNEKSPTWNPERYTLEDGSTVGFDFEQAWAKIDHSNPLKKGSE